jgi:hypothetical protein
VISSATHHFGIETVVGVVLLASIVVGIWAFIDAAMKSSRAFQSVGSRKTVWLLLIAVTVVALGPVGGAVGWYYLGIIRPRVDSGPLPGDVLAKR